MAANYSVKVTADTADLEASLAIARAETRNFQNALNSMAREAAAAGGVVSSELRGRIDEAASGLVNAKGKVTDFNTALKDTKSQAESAGGSMQLLTKGAELMGEAFAVERIAEFGAAVVESGERIAHMAEVLQITTTQLQVLQQAAVDSGSDADTLDGAMQRLAKTSSEAAEGSGKAALAFIEMGISASQNKAVMMEQISVYMMHADAVTRDRLSTEIFGRSGAQMIPIYEKASEGLENLTAEYEAQHRVVNDKVLGTLKNTSIAFSQFKGEVEGLAKVAMADGIETAKDYAGQIGKIADTVINFPMAAFREIMGMPELTAAPTTPKITPPPKPVGPTEPEQIAALDQLDSKLRLRADLTKEIAMAQKILDSATAAHDSAGIAKANEVIADLRKQLDGLNKQKNTSGFGNIGDKEISDTKTVNAEITANTSLSLKERFDLEQQNWQEILDGDKLNAKQRNDVTQEMAREQTAYQKAAAAENKAVTLSDLQTEIELSKQAYQEQKAALDAEVAQHKITKDQEVAILTQSLRDMEALQLQAVDVAAKGYEKDLAEWTKFQNQKKIIAGQTQVEISQLTSKGAVTDEKTYSDMEKAIEAGESSLVRGVLSGRQSMSQIVANLAETTLERIIDTQLKDLTHSIFVDNAKTLSAQASATAQVTADQAAKAQSGAADIAAGSAQIANDAQKAGAGAYQAVVGIPIVGPVLAPIAAATAFTAVMAFDALSSFDVGTNFVPSDMVAKVHQGERIIPAADNSALMSALSGGGQRGGGDQHFNANISISALDGASVQKLFARGEVQRAIAKGMAQQHRLNNSHLKSANW